MPSRQFGPDEVHAQSEGMEVGDKDVMEELTGGCGAGFGVGGVCLGVRRGCDGFGVQYVLGEKVELQEMSRGEESLDEGCACVISHLNTIRGGPASAHIRFPFSERRPTQLTSNCINRSIIPPTTSGINSISLISPCLIPESVSP